MIDQINSHRAENIITIEDPIEFVHPAKKVLFLKEGWKRYWKFCKSIKISIKTRPWCNFSRGNERLETISLALTAAETGHLVFGTLHASSASSTITRILDVFPPAQKEQAQTMLAGSIRLVMSQQLLKKRRRKNWLSWSYDRYSSNKKFN